MRPLPVPDVPASMVIQLASLDAVHEQGPPTITSTLPRPPFGPSSWSGGARTHVHEDTCVTVIEIPATTSTPERCGSLLAPTANDTCAGPVPEGCGSVSQGAPLAALQGQPAPVDNETVPVCAADDSDTAPGATLNVQPLGC